jgi:membrane-bound lytic murein transglycosylase D
MKLFALVIWLFFPFCLMASEGFPAREQQSTVVSNMQKLDAATPLSLVYNQDVQNYIDVYTLRRRAHLSTIIGRAELYFPLFEEHLDKMGLPLELKYLAVVESALDPKARSTSGATGLWQFLFQAARLFNLEMTSYMDERSDPVKSTIAACQYLKYLYDNFQDWNLALAAYNGGIAVVNEAIEKSGGERDYWKIRPWLTEETRGYVPAFIAVNYVMNHYHNYQIMPEKAPFKYDDLGFVHVGQSLSFQQLGKVLNVSTETMRWLNPVFIKDYIPVIEEPVEIVIPRDKVLLFYEKRHLLEHEDAPPVSARPPIGDTKGRQKVLHVVRKGEFFHRIAMDYGVRVEDVQHWNNLHTRHLMAGQKLIIWSKPDTEPLFSVQRSWMEAFSDPQDN